MADDNNIAILAITKHGISTSLKLHKYFPEWIVYAPEKFAATYEYDKRVKWYTDTTSHMIPQIFGKYNGMICMFSLGATIRLIAPHMKDKKTDPAVLVIDEMANFVISVLSGHIGGANYLAKTVAQKIGAQAVITTAADVKNTIPVDMVGRDLKWVIQDDTHITAVSAHMVNEDKIGIYQDAGTGIKEWYNKELPVNVHIYKTLDEMYKSDSVAYLIITDKIIIKPDISKPTVVYRPPTLIVGVGLHYNTTAQTIIDGITHTFEKYRLAKKSIAKISSMKKPVDIPGLAQAAKELDVQLLLHEKDRLAEIKVPNPSDTVKSFEGTASVSEASCMISCNMGSLIVEKQKFPPDLTIAVAREEAG